MQTDGRVRHVTRPQSVSLWITRVLWEGFHGMFSRHIFKNGQYINARRLYIFIIFLFKWNLVTLSNVQKLL